MIPGVASSCQYWFIRAPSILQWQPQIPTTWTNQVNAFVPLSTGRVLHTRFGISDLTYVRKYAFTWEHVFDRFDVQLAKQVFSIKNWFQWSKVEKFYNDLFTCAYVWVVKNLLRAFTISKMFVSETWKMSVKWSWTK